MRTMHSPRRSSGLLSIVGLALAAAACASSTGAPSGEVAGGAAQNLGGPRAKPPLLPAPGGANALAPWGGPDARHWRPEATLANATSEALNRAWALPNVKDAVVAVPAKMLKSAYAEFGDGQLNSVPSFSTWTTRERPPVVATLIEIGRASCRERVLVAV